MDRYEIVIQKSPRSNQNVSNFRIKILNMKLLYAAIKVLFLRRPTISQVMQLADLELHWEEVSDEG